MPRNIFTSGIELSDAELKALPIDIMAVWLDMWKEARDPEQHAYNAFASEREVEREFGYRDVAEYNAKVPAHLQRIDWMYGI